MAAKKKSSGFMSHLIITVIGVGGAFFAGWMMAGSGQGEVETLIADLKSDVEANAGLIDANKRAGGVNKKGVDDSLRKIGSLNSSVSRDLSALKSGIASTGEGIIYVNKVLGLKWVVRPETRHRYCLIPYPMPWHMAQDFAKKVGGSLAVIEDEKENKWIADIFGSSTEFWIGLTDERDEGKWIWVNGLDSVFTNWATPEPDNYRKMQHHVIMNKQAARGTTQAGKWNDIAGNEIKIGIIESVR